MATLKRLIEGQNVTFDTHQAGDGQQTNWHGVHLEKKLHDGGGKIRFPLIGGFEPSWSSRISRNQYEGVRREVQRELRKNQKLVNDLVETVVDVLTRYSSGEATVESSMQSARKLAEYFGLGEQFEKAVGEYMENRLTSLTTYYINPGKRELQEIRFSSEKVEIRRSRRLATPNYKGGRNR
jgi:hypothetical protein